MSLFDRFRPRWKHSDPQVRKEAVGALTDHALLIELFETDPSEDVRAAACARITDQEFLAEVAKGEGPHNLGAAQRLTEPLPLADVANNARSARVRAAVVERITDDQLLQRIASLDIDPEVRLRAKQRHEGPDKIRDYLKTTLSKLHVAQRKADRVAEFCGTLDDVCGTLVANSRYRINAVVSDPAPASTDHNPTPDFSCIELLADRHAAPEISAKDRVQRVVYRIKVWRQGENDFSGAVEERRYEMSSNVIALSDSSKSD
jgi:hypothetical protein